jgi:hypothetical protein
MIVRPKHFKFRIEAQHEHERILDEIGMPPEFKEALIPEDSFAPFFVTAPDYCFYCGEKLTIPAVMWNGRHPTDKDALAEVWLHPSCAEHFVTGLRRDIAELRDASHPADEK